MLVTVEAGERQFSVEISLAYELDEEQADRFINLQDPVIALGG